MTKPEKQSIFLTDLVESLFFIRGCSQHEFDREWVKFKAQINAMIEDSPDKEYEFTSYLNIVRNMAEVNNKDIPTANMYDMPKSTVDVKQAIQDFTEEKPPVHNTDCFADRRQKIDDPNIDTTKEVVINGVSYTPANTMANMASRPTVMAGSLSTIKIREGG